MKFAAASRVAVAVGLPAEKRSRAERRGEPPIMRRAAQGSYTNVELVGQDLKRHSIMLRPLRRERLGLANDGLSCAAAGVRRAECFEGRLLKKRARWHQSGGRSLCQRRRTLYLFH